MWKPSSNSSDFSMPTVLIVESGKGEVFIVDNESAESQVDRILKKSRKDLSAEENARQQIKIEIRECSPPPSPALPPQTIVIK